MEELIIPNESLASLRSQVVVVTGGASGIGLAAVKLLLSLGAKVISIDWKEDSGQVASDSEDHEYVKADVTSWIDLRAAFNRTIRKHGHVDHVFANAGAWYNTLLHFLCSDGRRLTAEEQESIHRAFSCTTIWMPVVTSKNQIFRPLLSVSLGPFTQSNLGPITSRPAHAVGVS